MPQVSVCCIFFSNFLKHSRFPKNFLHFIDPEQIVIKIIIEITPSIESGVQDEVTSVKQQNGELITIISDRLGPEIENLIKNIDFTPSISEELMEEILRVMPPR